MLSFLRSFCYTSACCSNAAPLRASSSAGQSWRLITAWSRVQVLPGPYKKRHPFGCLFCILGQAGLEQGGSDNAVGRVSNQPSRLLLSPRVPTTRNVYQERVLPIRVSFIPHHLRAAGSTGGNRCPAFPAAVRVRLLRLPLPHRYWDWTSRCSRRCAGTYADGFFRLGVHITEHMIRWPFLFAPIAADPAFCRKLHQIPPFAQ